MNDNYLEAPPNPSAMIEALRGLGYSTATALADIIDNSISARATQIDIGFSWNGADSSISVVDNGFGMDADELKRAMTLGQKNPLDYRIKSDLGRFGMGLKTASFSQCRVLTVASRQLGGLVNCLRWDLDFLAQNPQKKWTLLNGPYTRSAGMLSLIGQCGTIVIWDQLDRIITPGFSQQNYLDLIDDVEGHLSMIFHRFLEETNLTITINEKQISPWDPFLSDNPSTSKTPEECIETDGGSICVRGFVLPHRDRFTPQEHKRAAGVEGWAGQQGCYIYRNRRLLVAGGWLGLGRGRQWTREEAYQLARIRIDIPNSADSDWKIDIRKSRAQPPQNIRERLVKIAEEVRRRAREVYAYRGSYKVRTPAEEAGVVWHVNENRSGARYSINRTHPSLLVVFGLLKDQSPLLENVLRVIEETVPIQRIWLDSVEVQESPRRGFSEESLDELRSILVDLYKHLTSVNRMSHEEACDKLRITEPFAAMPDLIRNLPGILERTDDT